MGDVFTVPVDDVRAGIGQVVGAYGKSAYFLAIYREVVDFDSACDSVDLALESGVLFLALSLDAKVHVGDWEVIGQRPVDQRMPLPAYKATIGPDARVEVIDYSGTRRRPASQVEAEFLPYRRVVAPVRLEKALRAKVGLEPWQEDYAELAPEMRTTTARMFA